MTASVTLEHSATSYKYRILQNEDGSLAYQSGLAPELVDTVRQDNYSYGHIPPQVAVILAFENWHKGAGWSDALEDEYAERSAGGDPDAGGITTHRYHFSRGIDASWAGRLYLSPALQALVEDDATAIGAAPDYFSRTSDGVFMVAGRYLYEFDGTDWTLRDDHGVGDAHTGPVVDFNGTQFCPAGDSDPYVFSTDGVTWADVTTLADTAAYKFVVRGQSSGAAVLWKISSTGALKSNTDGTSSGGEWSSAVQVGGAGDTVGGMVVVGGDIIITKTDGIYSYDGTTVSLVWEGGRNLYRASNGSNPTVAGNNRVYTTYGDALCEYDHAENTVRFLWPHAGDDELNGQITAIAADPFNLAFVVKNAAGNNYVMIGSADTAEFHTLAYLGANDCDALLFVGPGDVHANNPVLLCGYGTAGNYFIRARAGLYPEDDSNYRFDTTEGYIVGPWTDVGARGFTKFLNGGIVLARDLATGKYAKLSYEIDASGDYVALFTADSESRTEQAVADDVEFSRIRYRLDMKTPSATSTPVMESVVFNTTLNNPRKRLWSYATEVASDIPTSGGSRGGSGRALRKHLFAAPRERVTFHDIDGEKYRARVIAIDGISATADTREVKERFQVTLVEI